MLSVSAFRHPQPFSDWLPPSLFRIHGQLAKELFLDLLFSLSDICGTADLIQELFLSAPC